MSYDTAVRYAQIRSEWNGDDWWLLEEAAFSKHSRARFEIIAKMPRPLWRKVPKRANPNPILRVVNPIILFARILVDMIFPLLTFAFMAGWVLNSIPPLFDGFTPDPAQVGIAGGISAIVALSSLPALIFLLLKPKQEIQDELTGDGMHIVTGLNSFFTVGAFVIAVIATAVGLAVGVWGLIPLIASAILAVILRVLHRKAVKSETEDLLETPPMSSKEINRLKDPVKTQILADLAEAYRTLLHKGLIDNETAQKAAIAPLGELGAVLGTPKVAEEAK